MTLLALISNHFMHVQCKHCNHQAEIAVQDLLEREGRMATVDSVLAKARCSNCRKPGRPDVRLYYKAAVSQKGEANSDSPD